MSMPFTDGELKELISEANKLRREINSIKEDNPADLSLKLDKYIDLQYYIGELYSQAIYDANMAYHKRKEEFFKARDWAHGSETYKDNFAEAETVVHRQKEQEAKSVMKRWEQQYNNCEQKCNSLKKRLEVMSDDMYGRNGRSGGR